MCDAASGPIRPSFNPQLRVELRGATVSLLLARELDERLGLSARIEHHLSDPRTGRNTQTTVFNVLMVLVAIIAIALAVPRG